MKYIVYILAALLTFAGVFYIISIILPEIIDRYGFFTGPDNSLHMWYEMSFYIIQICAYFVLGILSLIQLKRSTPGMLLLFCGITFFGSLEMITLLQWRGLLFTAAGLLPAIYVLIKHGSLVNGAPFQSHRNKGLLIAAGALASLLVVNRIYLLISDVLLYTQEGQKYPLQNFLSGFTGIAVSVCITIFCFLGKRRTSVLYRMFFTGQLAFAVLFIPIIIMSYVIVDSYYVEPLYMIYYIISIAVALLISIHAFKTRHDSLITQEHTDSAPQSEIPVS